MLDYAIWSETREEFGKPLDRTAKNLPKDFIFKSVAKLQERCQRLYEAKGGFFEEGRHACCPL